MVCKKSCKCNLCREDRSFKLSKIFNMNKKTNRNQQIASKKEPLRSEKVKTKNFALKRQSSFLENDQCSVVFNDPNDNKFLKKSFSCTEIWNKTNQGYPAHSSENITNIIMEMNDEGINGPKKPNEIKKTVIYFGDSISSKRQQVHKSSLITVCPSESSEKLMNFQNTKKLYKDTQHIAKDCSDSKPTTTTQIDGNLNKQKKNELETGNVKSESSLVMEQLKVVLKEKCNDAPKVTVNKITATDENISIHNNPDDKSKLDGFVEKCSDGIASAMENKIYISENDWNDVISIKIKDSYDVATKLVKAIESNECNEIRTDNYNEFFLDVGGEVNNMYFDWSFVQDWRSR